ncbi:MAG: glycine cleavage system protein GcvH [Phycisphaerae bacterium]|nr:glycine cleavage system protein GcvH [Phycisphaerae bacterium]
MVPKDLLYTSEHEWVKVENSVATVGITNHAQNALGDIVFVDLPDVDKEFAKGDEAIALESAKAAASIYAPVTGKITEVNNDLDDDPALVNNDCYAGGWMFKISINDEADLAGLMDAGTYEDFLKSQD